ncbi:MAG: flavodoxin [Clostridia bacterium]|nr:flavodoxin [Clostridia bacterium]
MKKSISILLSLFILLSFTLTSCAAEQAEIQNEAEEIILQIGNPNMTVNGTNMPIDSDGTVPVIVNGRTLLPVRAVVETMGGTADWDEDTQAVTLNCGENKICLTINNTDAYLNDNINTLDTAPTIINNRTMLPIRFIAESFGYSVEWEQITQTTTIKKEIQNTMVIYNTDTADNYVLINGGTFTMGSPESELERDSDEMQHNVMVDSFYISKTELTQEEYQSVMGDNPSEQKGEKLPVTNITWYDAVAFCNKMSEKDGLTPCYTIDGNTVIWDKGANGYRLPTEAEWEYAARANTQTPFSFGDYVHDENANCYNAYGYNNDTSGSWVNGYLSETVEVDSYEANDFGLYNMHGNAAEWVWDWYGNYDTADTQNPTGAESGYYKIARGSGWNDFPKHIRSAYRSAFPADIPLYSIGMRLVRSAQAGTGTVVSTDLTSDTTPNKTLIVYFSEGGNTKGFAEIIAEMTGVDIFRIERATDYRSTYSESLAELREAATPTLKQTLEEANIDISQYDTILLGYCNWWASIPAPIRTFLTSYDLSGKTIIPFASQGGGKFGQTISAVAKLAPKSTIREGKFVTYSSYPRDEIKEWLKENNFAVN